MAQSSFTIVRPADGSKVREKVRVLIPKNSVDSNSYIGVFLNGKFVQATMPPVEGNYRVYTLDTKSPIGSVPEFRNGIPDGEMKLELVKYEGGDAPRIVDRSSVSITVGNHMNVNIPAGGIHLRYAFKPGERFVYHIYEKETLETLSGLGNQNGGHPAQFPTNLLDYRLLYAVDNTYGNGDALLRTQNLPNKGKDYAMLQIEGEPDPRQIFDYQMMPVYMRINSVGRPSFGAVPEYFGFSSGGATEGGEYVYGADPLPVLPQKAVAPGSNWNAVFEFPIIQAGQPISDIDQVTAPFDMRGDFIDAEWEMGHPCAKIRNSIAAGSTSIAEKQLQKQGMSFSGDKIALDETIYFALDTHKIVKIIRSITLDRKMEVQDNGAMGNNMGSGPSGPGGGSGPRMAGAAGAGGGGGGKSSTANQTLPNRQGKNGQFGGPPAGSVPHGPPGSAGQGPGPGSFGGGSRGQRSGGTVSPRTQYLRIRHEETMILEQ